MYWVWVRISPGEGAVLGVAAAVKCIRLRKQQTPAAAHGSASRPMRGFRMDSPAAGVTSARAMWPFVKVFDCYDVMIKQRFAAFRRSSVEH